ncbi:hypothetical protein TNCV_2055122 [Trichonephila clavipes]|uniref:Uncharacterized protein n=1 Tax=Trichonephila clavipes TaxID=2585209 RepID=A0A8X6RPJ8_TRICX|nr:hypothetical protein TNCV_2055122 [Trichonephila clavipes]
MQKDMEDEERAAVVKQDNLRAILKNRHGMVLFKRVMKILCKHVEEDGKRILGSEKVYLIILQGAIPLQIKQENAPKRRCGERQKPVEVKVPAEDVNDPDGLEFLGKYEMQASALNDEYVHAEHYEKIDGDIEIIYKKIVVVHDMVEEMQGDIKEKKDLERETPSMKSGNRKKRAHEEVDCLMEDRYIFNNYSSWSYCQEVPPHQLMEDDSSHGSSHHHTSYTKAFGGGPCNFEPWSSDEKDTLASAPYPNYHTNNDIEDEERAAVVKENDIEDEERAAVVKENDIEDEERAAVVKENDIEDEERAAVVKENDIEDEERAAVVKEKIITLYFEDSHGIQTFIRGTIKLIKSFEKGDGKFIPMSEKMYRFYQRDGELKQIKQENAPKRHCAERQKPVRKPMQ